MKKLSLFGLIFLAGCGGIKQSHISKLRMDMEKEKVRSILGEPDSSGATVQDGREIEAWVYTLKTSQTPQQQAAAIYCTICTLGLCFPLLFVDGPPVPYHVYFANDRLKQWGRGFDWQPTPNQINEIRMR